MLGTQCPASRPRVSTWPGAACVLTDAEHRLAWPLAESPNARGPSRRTSPQELLVYAVKAYAGCCCGFHVHLVVPHALGLLAAADEGKLASAAVLVLELVL